MSAVDVLRRVAQEHGVTLSAAPGGAGPTVQTYRLFPAPGVAPKRVQALVPSWSLELATNVRWIGPDRGALVVEVPRPDAERAAVRLDEVCDAGPTDAYALTIPVGVTSDGYPLSVTLDSLPHMIVAGATGQGKSVYVNGLLTALLRQAGPDRLALLLADPKRVELAAYADLPHLLAPVATETTEILDVLQMAVDEMERRYALMADAGVKHVRQLEVPPPRLVVLVDELADVMLSAKKEAERLIQALTQKARAAGVHVILATQRPSVDVVTGVVKANVPTRLSFAVASMTDSRVVLDANGAEDLVGAGDGLLMMNGRRGLARVQAALVTDDEVAAAVAAHVSPRGLSPLSEPVAATDSALQDENARLRAELAAALARPVVETSVASASPEPVKCKHDIHDVLAAELTEDTRRRAADLDTRMTQLENAYAALLETLANIQEAHS